MKIQWHLLYCCILIFSFPTVHRSIAGFISLYYLTTTETVQLAQRFILFQSMFIYDIIVNLLMAGW